MERGATNYCIEKGRSNSLGLNVNLDEGDENLIEQTNQRDEYDRPFGSGKTITLKSNGESFIASDEYIPRFKSSVEHVPSPRLESNHRRSKSIDIDYINSALIMQLAKKVTINRIEPPKLMKQNDHHFLEKKYGLIINKNENSSNDRIFDDSQKVFPLITNKNSLGNSYRKLSSDSKINLCIIGGDLQSFVQEFNLHFMENKITDDRQRHQLILFNLHPDDFRIAEKIAFNVEEETPYENWIERLMKINQLYVTGSRLESHGYSERYAHFNKRERLKAESYEKFMSALIDIATKCNLKDDETTNRIIAQFIVGINNASLQKLLLSKIPESIDKALAVVRIALHCKEQNGSGHLSKVRRFVLPHKTRHQVNATHTAYAVHHSSGERTDCEQNKEHISKVHRLVLPHTRHYQININHSTTERPNINHHNDDTDRLTYEYILKGPNEFFWRTCQVCGLYGHKGETCKVDKITPGLNSLV